MLQNNSGKLSIGMDGSPLEVFYCLKVYKREMVHKKHILNWWD